MSANIRHPSDKLDYERMARVVECLEKVVKELGS